MTPRKHHRVVATIIAALAVFGIAAGVTGALTVGFPFVTSNTQKGTEAGIGHSVRHVMDQVDGYSFSVTNVLADPEQTSLAYRVDGDRNGPFVTIVPRPRLVLESGTIIPLSANRQSGADNLGTLVFPGLTEGTHSVTLVIDGIQTEKTTLQKKFAMLLVIDNHQGYAMSARQDLNVAGGDGATRIALTEIVRTPSLVVARGRFDGLDEEAIKALVRPEVNLITNGASQPAGSVHMGFGPDLKNFELRFAAVPAGDGIIEFAGFDAASGPPSAAFQASPTRMPVRIP